MEGESTLDEERELGLWFRSHEVDDSLKPYREMFAAFDRGLPFAQPDTPAPVATRRHIWHWAAAAVILGLTAVAGWRLMSHSETSVENNPLVAEEITEPIDTAGKTRDAKPLLAENRQESTEQSAHAVSKTKKTAKKRTAIPKAVSSRQDSIEVTRTEGELELAESEYIAEQQELKQQLLEFRQQRAASQSGWHYTILPCE